ncbi:MAG: DNA topoisomerase IV subunit A, partial [Sulfuritalea sp.]|nr:DNA topoisomerase IV subunit A [Sulfuritalea sp.]
SVSLNLTMVGRDGRPKQKNLLTILHEWIEFRFATVERRTRHRLAEVLRRVHILEGRMTVFLRIDEVIRCIRESDEPKPELMATFDLSELQAEDILEIRLRQLARLEGIRIEKELGDLRVEHDQLNKLLDSRHEMTKLILKEINDDSKRFGDDRRTLMEAVTPISQGEIAVPDEPVTVIISKNGWVRSRQGHGIDPTGITYKAGDSPWLVAESRSVWPLIVLDSNGRSYSIRVSDLPGGRGDGAPLNTMIDFQEGGKLTQALTAAPQSKYLVAGSGGYGFIASIADMMARNKAGKAFLTLDAGEKPVPAAAANGDTVAVLTQAGRLLLFPLADLKEMAKGKGLMLVDLTKNDEVVGVAVTAGQTLLIGGSGRGGKLVQQALDSRAQAAFRGARARRGQEIPFRLKPSSLSLKGEH